MKKYFFSLLVLFPLVVLAMDEKTKAQNFEYALASLKAINKDAIKKKLIEVAFEGLGDPRINAALLAFLQGCKEGKEIPSNYVTILSRKGLFFESKGKTCYPIDSYIQEATLEVMQEGLDFQKLLTDSHSTQSPETIELSPGCYTL